jgi:peptide/nickel transport system ATP-binding protein
MTEPLIRIHNLRVAFNPVHPIEAVKGVSFDIPAHRTVALVGESGSGKSVSAMSIVRLLPDNAVVAAESQIWYQGKDLLRAPMDAMRQLRGKDISVVFQEPMSSLNPVFTVGEQIAEVLRLHLRLNRKQALDRALELMNEVGIPRPKERLNAYPHQLSGGQQQRVMIAMAIACEPQLLIADEPTTALDVTVQRQIMELLAQLQQRKKMSILFISHDLGLVGEIADSVVVMRHGTVREAGAVKDVFTHPQDSYTRELIACSRPKERMHATPADGAPLLEVKGLRKDYTLKTGFFRREVFSAVKDAHFTLHKGRTLGVVGESGSGKTTIGMMLTRLTDATAGSIHFEGVDLAQLTPKQMQAYRRRIQIIFQNPYASLNPRFTVGQILHEPMRIHAIGKDETERTQRAIALLEKVGLSADAMGKYPHEFSGGQRQRIAIARCLTMQPEIIICDESVSALDVSVQATVLNLLLDLQKEFGLSYVFISHDLAVVKYMADDILVMHNGEMVEHGSADAVYHRPQMPYTQQLLGAIPKGWGVGGTTVFTAP